jgi:hypothetical protein
MSFSDEQLRELINNVTKYKNTNLSRQKALNKLLRAIAQLPGIYRSSHQDYGDAYNRTLEWASKNIDRFEMRGNSVQTAFVTWINGYLKWRVRDLYTSDDRYTFGNFHLLDIDWLENIPHPEYSLNLLERQIAEMQANKRQDRGLAVRKYLETDPQNILTNCCLRKNPQCHCQLLVQELLLKEPPQKIADVSRDLGISNQTIYTHWKQKCLPLLKEIATSLVSEQYHGK